MDARTPALDEADRRDRRPRRCWARSRHLSLIFAVFRPWLPPSLEVAHMRWTREPPALCRQNKRSVLRSSAHRLDRLQLVGLAARRIGVDFNPPRLHGLGNPAGEFNIKQAVFE